VHPTETASEASETPRIVGAIPARYDSERLPGKPLAEISGRPLIEHVYRRAQQAESLSAVVVLTDDERIATAVKAFGGDVEMTPIDCASGTDRIAWAARNWEVDAVINIQGDEPLIESAAIDALGWHLAEHPEDPVVTLAAPAMAEDDANPNVVKVVRDLEGYALYFSRSPLPYRRNPGAPGWRHLGIYGYQYQSLLEIAALAPTPLERSESLEQLRMLENGYRLRVLEVERAAPGVDTAEDLEHVRKLIESAEPGTPQGV
jgi:3-deoxy-manno-octulosonate cytidylyltransferase (CMP-KDO synthetase)